MHDTVCNIDNDNLAIQGEIAPVVSPPPGRSDALSDPVETAAHQAQEGEGTGGSSLVGKSVAATVKAGSHGFPPMDYQVLARTAHLDKIEAVLDPWYRARLIIRYDIRATCERSRRLICSVADEGIIGPAVQERLNVSPPASPGPLQQCFVEYQQKLKAGRKRQVRHSSVMSGLSLLNVQSELIALAEVTVG